MSNFEKIPELKIGDLTAKIPIIQGGMGVGISLAGLAAAVANAGGIGVISAAGIGMLEPDFRTNFKEANERALRKEIRKARAQTDGIVGFNIMVALSDYDDLVVCAIEEDADILFVGAGLPLHLPKNITPDRLKEIRTRFVPIVSSARAAQMIFQYWLNKYHHVPDGVVVEGPMAGGHLGFKREQINDPDYALEKLVSGVIAVIKPFEQRLDKHIPVIAAGGIYTGSDIYKYLNLGVQGVQMGTRFVTTHECDAHIRLKEAYVKSRREDLIIIDSPVGLPGRAIRNTFLSDVSAGIKKPFKCPWKCLKTCKFQQAPYCIALALTNAQSGNLEHGFSFAGANTYRTDKIISVRELMESLVQEYEEASLSTIPESHTQVLT